MFSTVSACGVEVTFCSGALSCFGAVSVTVFSAGAVVLFCSGAAVSLAVDVSFCAVSVCAVSCTFGACTAVSSVFAAVSSLAGTGCSAGASCVADSCSGAG